MKTLLVLLLLCVIGGAFGWQYYQRSQNPTVGQQAAALAERTREVAGQAKEIVAAKAEEWKLTPDNIKEELGKTGRIVRSRAIAIGERMDDARIVAVIKGKYVVEKNLSSFDISVECHDGAVKLTGSVTSPAQVGQAMALALQTNGVHNVISDLSVKT
jgi:osmotically-inducible protein OsmY